MKKCIISKDIFKEILNKFNNWKTPGPDNIYNFCIKNINALHDNIIYNFNQYLRDLSIIHEGFLKEKTHLLLKTEQFRPKIIDRSLV